MLNILDQHNKDMEREFEETLFAKGGGSCFECCDYEGMYNDLKSFLLSQNTALYKKFIEGEIEWAKAEIDYIQKHSKGNYADGMVETATRLIYHLEQQLKELNNK